MYRHLQPTDPGPAGWLRNAVHGGRCSYQVMVIPPAKRDQARPDHFQRTINSVFWRRIHLLFYNGSCFRRSCRSIRRNEDLGWALLNDDLQARRHKTTARFISFVVMPPRWLIPHNGIFITGLPVLAWPSIAPGPALLARPRAACAAGASDLRRSWRWGMLLAVHPDCGGRCSSG